jgi:DNA-binding FadR family transcriptional regulator
MKPEIKPVSTLSLVDQVEVQLMDFLSRSGVKAGDVLPKEVELAESFGVSRTVVREALTRLRVRGLIESSKRKGSVVTHPDLLFNFEQVLHPQILDRDTLRDVFEMRLVLEVGMADLVFARRTEADLDVLRKMVKDEPEAGSEFIFETDFEVRFHGKLYEITGNRTLRRFQTVLLPVFGWVHHSVQNERRDPNRPFVTHRGLVDILEGGTPDDFRKAMRLHLDNHFRRVFENAVFHTDGKEDGQTDGV